jgi:hypothetical protein
VTLAGGVVAHTIGGGAMMAVPYTSSTLRDFELRCTISCAGSSYGFAETRQSHCLTLERRRSTLAACGGKFIAPSSMMEEDPPSGALLTVKIGHPAPSHPPQAPPDFDCFKGGRLTRPRGFFSFLGFYSLRVKI